VTVELPARVVPAVSAAGLPATSITALFAAITNGTAAAFAAVPGFSADIGAVTTEAVQDAYSSSFMVVYLSSLAFGGLSIIAAFFATDLAKYLTNFVNKSVDARHTLGEREVHTKEFENA